MTHFGSLWRRWESAWPPRSIRRAWRRAFRLRRSCVMNELRMASAPSSKQAIGCPVALYIPRTANRADAARAGEKREWRVTANIWVTSHLQTLAGPSAAAPRVVQIYSHSSSVNEQKIAQTICRWKHGEEPLYASKIVRMSAQ